MIFGISLATLGTFLLIAGVFLLVLTICDHLLNIACPVVIEVGIKPWQLFLHKIWYIAAGAITVLLTQYLT